MNDQQQKPICIPKATTCRRNSYGAMERNVNTALQPPISTLFPSNLRGQGGINIPTRTAHCLGKFPLMPIAQIHPPNSQWRVLNRVPNNIIPCCP